MRGTMAWVEKVNIAKPDQSCWLVVNILKKDLFCIL